MKYILHVGSYDFEISDPLKAASIAEILKSAFIPDKYYDHLDVGIEFKKEED